MKKIGILLSLVFSLNIYAESCEIVKAELSVKENKEEKIFIDIELCDLTKDKIYTATASFNYSNFKNKESFFNVELDLTRDYLVLNTESNNGKFYGVSKKEFNKTIELNHKNEMYYLKLIK